VLVKTVPANLPAFFTAGLFRDGIYPLVDAIHRLIDILVNGINPVARHPAFQ
jgi:hypothetical protein